MTVKATITKRISTTDTLVTMTSDEVSLLARFIDSVSEQMNEPVDINAEDGHEYSYSFDQQDNNFIKAIEVIEAIVRAHR